VTLPLIPGNEIQASSKGAVCVDWYMILGLIMMVSFWSFHFFRWLVAIIWMLSHICGAASHTPSRSIIFFCRIFAILIICESMSVICELFFLRILLSAQVCSV